MTDLPPAYDFLLPAYTKLPKEDKDHLRAIANLPEKAKVAGARAIEKALTADKHIQETLNEVRKLACEVVEINDTFEKVRLDLVDVDNKLKDYGLEKLAPEWKGYQRVWTDNFLESREAASNTEAYVREFLRFVFPKVEDADTEEKVKAAQKRLKEFAQTKDPSKGKTGRLVEYANELVKLSVDLGKFKDKFDAYVKKAETKVDDEIALNKKSLEDTSKAIESCQTWITWSGITFGVGVFGVIVSCSAAAALAPIAPLASAGLLVAIGGAATLAGEASMAALILKMREMDKLRAEENLLKKKGRELIDQKNAVEQVRITLSHDTPEIAKICERISHIASVWHMVARDATQLSEDLQYAYREDDLDEFKQRLKYLKVNYETLKEALYIYSTKVTGQAVESDKK